MKKLIVITLGIITLGTTVFAKNSTDNSNIELSHYIANNHQLIKKKQYQSIKKGKNIIMI